MIGQQPGVQYSRQELNTERKDCPTEKIYCDRQFGASGLKNNVSENIPYKNEEVNVQGAPRANARERSGRITLPLSAD